MAGLANLARKFFSRKTDLRGGGWGLMVLGDL